MGGATLALGGLGFVLWYRNNVIAYPKPKDSVEKPNDNYTFGSMLMLVRGVQDGKYWIVPIINDFDTFNRKPFLERI